MPKKDSEFNWFQHAQAVRAVEWEPEGKAAKFEKFLNTCGYIIGFALLFGLPVLALISKVCGWGSL